MPHPKTPLENASKSPPWWTFPYVWMILMGPALVVVAALWTGYIAHQGADQVLTPSSSSPHLSAQQIQSNHATTRHEIHPHSQPSVTLSLEQQAATQLGERHE